MTAKEQALARVDAELALIATSEGPGDLMAIWDADWWAERALIQLEPDGL